MLHDVTGDFEEIALVLNRNQRPLGTVVHRDLERFDEGAQSLDVALTLIPDCGDTDSSAAPSALEHGAYIPLDHHTFLQ